MTLWSRLFPTSTKVAAAAAADDTNNSHVNRMARPVLYLYLVGVIGSIVVTCWGAPHHHHTSYPKDCLAPLDQYPNRLPLTDEDRANFHPVVKFPLIWMDNGEVKRRVPNYRILDLQTSSGMDELVTEEERLEYRNGKRRERKNNHEGFAVGRYDENRVNLYASDMFDDTEHAIDGYTGQRTVHIGIDLDGPVGTKVYSFCDGIVHSAGYNADLGDYGNVIVVEHHLEDNEEEETPRPRRKIYALYGHLNDKSIVGMEPGMPVQKGQVLGRMGDVHENGGWRISHVHFQLSLEPPETHDMPGVVSLHDRPRALLQYPDPRLVLGELY